MTKDLKALTNVTSRVLGASVVRELVFFSQSGMESCPSPYSDGSERILKRERERERESERERIYAHIFNAMTKGAPEFEGLSHVEHTAPRRLEGNLNLCLLTPHPNNAFTQPRANTNITLCPKHGHQPRDRSSNDSKADQFGSVDPADQ